MEVKSTLLGTVIGVIGLGALLTLEPQLIGALMRVQNLAIGQQNVNSIPGPNTDVATTLDILKTAVDKAVKERDAAYGERDRVGKELEVLRQEKVKEEKILEDFKTSANSQKLAIQKELDEAKAERDEAKKEVDILEGKLPPKSADGPDDSTPNYTLVPIPERNSFPTKGFRRLRYNAFYCGKRGYKECYSCSIENEKCEIVTFLQDVYCGKEREFIDTPPGTCIEHPRNREMLCPVFCRKKS